MDEQKDFPVDEATFLALEHAMGGSYEYDEDDDRFYIVGADYGFPDLMEFLSGVTEHDYVEEYSEEVGEFYVVCRKPMFHHEDVILALIKEVRRLRGFLPEEIKEP